MRLHQYVLQLRDTYVWGGWVGGCTKNMGVAYALRFWNDCVRVIHGNVGIVRGEKANHSIVHSFGAGLVG
jgi:hypothetical protein